jgi:hypothetical protein
MENNLKNVLSTLAITIALSACAMPLKPQEQQVLTMSIIRNTVEQDEELLAHETNIYRRLIIGSDMERKQEAAAWWVRCNIDTISMQMCDVERAARYWYR